VFNSQDTKPLKTAPQVMSTGHELRVLF